MLAWILLGILFLLIAIVLLLPRIPAVQRMAGIDATARSVDYVLIPSQFGLSDDEGAELPSRVLTANYRNWWVRPIAITADDVRSDLPSSFNPVSVIHGRSKELEEALNRYRPRQVTLHFFEEAEGERDTPRPDEAPISETEQGAIEADAAAEASRITTDPAKSAQGLGYALATGNHALAFAYVAAPGMTAALAEIPASARS